MKITFQKPFGQRTLNLSFSILLSLTLGLISACDPISDWLGLPTDTQPSSPPDSSPTPPPETGDPYEQQPTVSTQADTLTETVRTSPGESTQLELSDGTQVGIPALDSAVELRLERRSNDLEPKYGGLAKTGSLRQLSFEKPLSMKALGPVTVSFPATEYGRINPDTLSVARVADLVIDGVLQKDHFTLLPAEVDEQGQVIASDYLLGQAQNLKTEQLVLPPGGPAVTVAKFTIKYYLVTQQANLNWAAPPQLIRMVPDKELPERRKPIDLLSALERSQEDKRCLRNVVVLVHGHNEAEKDGNIGRPDVVAPWNFSYKRDVWTLLYDYFLKSPALQKQSSCTAFYEYIYPSYRPLYNNLGPDLTNQLRSALQPLMRDPDFEPNLLIVAHSMGGLVSRSAIQTFDPAMHKAFQKLVTWGSPHHGSILPSLSYVLNAGPAYSLLGQADAETSDILSRLVQNYGQMDAPGARDLRWDNSRPLRLDEWFTNGPEQPDNEALYSLTEGKRIYNQPLSVLNQADYYGSNEDDSRKNKLEQLKYDFFFGTTDKTLINGELGLGATVNRRLIANPDETFEGNLISENDGAVAVTSAGGEGLIAERERFYGVDHEMFFGAPTAPASFNGESNFTKPEDAATVVGRTFNQLHLGTLSFEEFFECDPFIRTITPQQGEGGSQVTIKGHCFNNRDNKLAVYFNRRLAPGVIVKSCHEITATVPANAGSGEVMVVSEEVMSNGVPFTMTGATPAPSCNHVQAQGTWAVTYTDKTTSVSTNFTLNPDGTFTTSDGSGGTWTSGPNEYGGWYVEIVFKKGTTYSGSVQAPGCELRGKVYSAQGTDLGGEWVGHR